MQRERWNSSFVFVLAAIGSAIGIGNFWRFPYLTYEYGGGAFLIPFLLAFIIVGLPLMIMEFALGQKFQKSTINAFESIRKGFGFIGVLAVSISFIIMTYYSIILAWSLKYLFSSFSLDTLPWVGKADAYFNEVVLNITPGISQFGSISWSVLFSLFLIWVILYFVVWKGVSSLQKVVLVMMPIPLILLIVLFIRGITLPGSLQGIMAFIKPDFSALVDPQIWITAVSQIFFSFSLGFGIMVAYSSFNKKKDDVVVNSFWTCTADVIISIFAGFVVFSILGYMAYTNGVPVNEVVDSGPGLAFVVFPEALSLMPFAWLFSIFFFLTLLTLGLSSAFSMVEAVNVSIGDKYKKPNRPLIAFFVCLVGFLIGILYTFGAGIYLLDLVDYFLNNYTLIIVGILEALAVGWVFGAKKLRAFVNETTRFDLGAWWDYIIKFVIPICLTGLLIWQLIYDIRNPYGDYPAWALAIGWASAIIPFVVGVLYLIFKKK